jgi:cell division protein FtsA
MPRKPERNLIVGLDIGTSKVVAIVGELEPDGTIEVVGVGSHPSRGLKKGVVVNIDSTVQSIQRAVEEAELMAGCEIHSVFAGIAGNHVRSLNSHGIVAIRDKEVTPGDVDRVIDAARAVAIPADQKILHILPQEFIIDAQEGIREPIGMSGVRLEAKVHIVTGADSAAQNIVKCVQRCGLEVEDIVLEQLASSYAVLADDEKELGVCLVDIGGGTTDIAVFSGGAIRHTAVIPIAGDQVTNDIALSLRTPTHHAEDLKIRYACALSQLANPDETIEVPSVGDRPARRLARQTLAEVVEPRYEELFALVREELRRSGFDELIAAGVVLTGGSAKMEGVIELAEEIFHAPVRLGLPQGVSGLVDVVRNPIHSTGVGLLLFGRENYVRPSRTACAASWSGCGRGSRGISEGREWGRGQARSGIGGSGREQVSTADRSGSGFPRLTDHGSSITFLRSSTQCSYLQTRRIRGPSSRSSGSAAVAATRSRTWSARASRASTSSASTPMPRP